MYRKLSVPSQLSCPVCGKLLYNAISLPCCKTISFNTQAPPGILWDTPAPFPLWGAHGAALGPPSRLYLTLPYRT